MPNTQNFKTNVASLSQVYTKYTVSRIVANKKDDLLDMEVPADFQQELLQNNIEINLYSLADNSLIFSDVIKNSDAIRTETLQYNDNTSRNLLYIDFAKVVPNLQIPSGQYSVTLNFFADEIGSYDSRILKVSKISTSRREVELKLTDIKQQNLLEQFAIPRIPAEYIEPVLIQIFNQEGANEVSPPTSPAKIDSASLYQNFGSGSGQLLIEYGFNVDDGERPGINTVSQNVLNIAYPIAKQTVNDMIVLSGSTSFTETELSKYVVDAIDVAYDEILNDEARNPSKYRFDLI
jgi:hypothetical protein